MADFVAAIDQGTTSTRCMVFDHSGAEVGRAQLEHRQILPRAGWVEHDPREIWERTEDGRPGCVATPGSPPPISPPSASPTSARPRWSGTAGPASRTATPSSGRTPGRPRSPRELDADGRGDADPGADRPAPGHLLLRRQAPVDPGPRRRRPTRRPRPGEALFGTIDSWLLWNLTGGPDGGVHLTDVTNASRTMLMDLRTARLGRRTAGALRRPARRCCPRSGPPRIRTCSDDRRRWSVRRRGGHRRGARRPACGHGRPGLLRRPARPRTPTAPATSCCSTPAPRWSVPSTAC